MLNGLDLFSGIGGLSIALNEWVRPIAYCEIDHYCQGVLLSRQRDKSICHAPIWDDIRTLVGGYFHGVVDIIYGGFPCQDISVAGHGKGLAGERSGLFFEIIRLAKEIKPKFLFLENVPAITSRGGIEIVRTITEMGYDCRWCVISAASVGALHLRERWFLLGYAKYYGRDGSEERGSSKASIYSCEEGKNQTCESKGTGSSSMLASESFSNSESNQSGGIFEPKPQSHPFDGDNRRFETCWWKTEPNVGRVADGIPKRVDRLRSLGNAVVPAQCKKAFQILMGIEKEQDG